MLKRWGLRQCELSNLCTALTAVSTAARSKVTKTVPEKQLLRNNFAARQSILLWESSSTSLLFISPGLSWEPSSTSLLLISLGLPFYIKDIRLTISVVSHVGEWTSSSISRLFIKTSDGLSCYWVHIVNTISRSSIKTSDGLLSHWVDIIIYQSPLHEVIWWSVVKMHKCLCSW